MTSFVDTSVLVAALKSADAHNKWSAAKIADYKLHGPILVVDIVYCELSVSMPDRSATDAAISELGLERYRTSDDALFRAGLAFKRYKDVNKGTKTGVLPDFIIGATAEIEGVPLLTTNQRDFVRYFQNLKLVHP